MKKTVKYLGMLLLVGSTACTLKYEALKDTSLPNPPSMPVKIYVKEFPVESKANVVDPRTANSAGSQGTQYVTERPRQRGKSPSADYAAFANRGICLGPCCANSARTRCGSSRRPIGSKC